MKELLTQEVDSKFCPSRRDIPLLNYNPHAYWLRFKLLNPYDSPHTLYLELDKHMSGSFDVFSPDSSDPPEGDVARADFGQKLSEREVGYKNPVVSLSMKPGKHTYYVRIDTGWWLDTVPLRIWTPEAFDHHRYYDNLLQGIIAGIFLLLAFYNLFIYFLMKDRSFVYLIMLILSQFAINLALSGLGFQYLWPNHPYLGISALLFFLPIQYAANILFCGSFLDTEKYQPPIHATLNGTVIFF